MLPLDPSPQIKSNVWYVDESLRRAPEGFHSANGWAATSSKQRSLPRTCEWRTVFDTAHAKIEIDESNLSEGDGGVVVTQRKRLNGGGMMEWASFMMQNDGSRLNIEVCPTTSIIAPFAACTVFQFVVRARTHSYR